MLIRIMYNKCDIKHIKFPTANDMQYFGAKLLLLIGLPLFYLLKAIFKLILTNKTHLCDLYVFLSIVFSFMNPFLQFSCMKCSNFTKIDIHKKRNQTPTTIKYITLTSFMTTFIYIWVIFAAMSDNYYLYSNASVWVLCLFFISFLFSFMFTLTVNTFLASGNSMFFLLMHFSSYLLYSICMIYFYMFILMPWMITIDNLEYNKDISKEYKQDTQQTCIDLTLILFGVLCPYYLFLPVIFTLKALCHCCFAFIFQEK